MSFKDFSQVNIFQGNLSSSMPTILLKYLIMARYLLALGEVYPTSPWMAKLEVKLLTPRKDLKALY